MEQEPASKEDFYRTCAELLGAVHEFRPWTHDGPNRWNNRHAGNGRFPGFGVIRIFGPNLVQFALRRPVAFRAVFRSPTEAIAALRNLRGGDTAGRERGED